MRRLYDSLIGSGLRVDGQSGQSAFNKSKQKTLVNSPHLSKVETT